MGGSYLCALNGLYLALTCKVESTDSKLAEGEYVFCTSVAPDKKTALQPYRYQAGAVRANPELSGLVVGVIGNESFVIQRHDGVSVCFEVAAASIGGSTLRGRTYVALLLDESSFFRDPESGAVNDLELYRAGAPRILDDGCLMIISTAWAKRGLLWDKVEKNHGNPQDCIAAIAPTMLVRPTAQNARIYNDMLESDPDNAEREFDCKALAIGTTDFFEADAIRQCSDESLPLVVLPTPDVISKSGIDTGFKRDPSALSIVHKKLKSPLVCAETFERPSEKEGASPKIVLAEFATHLAAHRCRSVMCDQHYVQTVRDELKGFTIQECPPTQEFKLMSHTFVRDLLRSRGVIIPAANRRLISQLRDVQVTPQPGGGMKISSPRRAGSHGDVASAFVLAAWAGRAGATVDWSTWQQKTAGIAEAFGYRGGRSWGVGL
jgi:hypothetical protein